MLPILLVLLWKALIVAAQNALKADILQGAGVTCTASSRYPGYPCQHVYNGDVSPGIKGAWASNSQNSGAWLEIRLPRPTHLTYISVVSRCVRMNQYSGVDFVFSDGSTKGLTLPCDGNPLSVSDEDIANCARTRGAILRVNGTKTNSIRMNFRSSCKTGGNPGLRQVQIQGIEFGSNVLNSGASCEASSHYGAFWCPHLVNGDFSPGPTGSWASNEQDTGAWVQFTLPRETILTSIAMWSRCARVDQYSGVDLVFSNGHTHTVALPCDGSTSPSSGDLWSNCEGLSKKEVALNNVHTKSVRMNFHASCQTGGHPGLREVEINGYELAGNIMREAVESCEASSTTPGYPCERVYNGNFSPGRSGSWASRKGNHGSWLTLKLKHYMNILSVKIWSRCCRGDQFKGAGLVFDEGARREMTFACDGIISTTSGDLQSNCNGLATNELDIIDIQTSSIQMEFYDSCASGSNPGLREVEMQGFAFAGDIMQGYEVGCIASTTHAGYRCSNILNNNLSPGSDGSWASEKQGSGAWLQVNFPHEMVVVNAEVWNRCMLRDQFSGVDLIFSEGTFKHMNMPCDGNTSDTGGDDLSSCDGQSGSWISLDNYRTHSVRLNFKASCAAGGYPGIREVRFQGYASGEN